MTISKTPSTSPRKSPPSPSRLAPATFSSRILMDVSNTSRSLELPLEGVKHVRRSSREKPPSSPTGKHSPRIPSSIPPLKQFEITRWCKRFQAGLSTPLHHTPSARQFAAQLTSLMPVPGEIHLDRFIDFLVRFNEDRHAVACLLQFLNADDRASLWMHQFLQHGPSLQDIRALATNDSQCMAISILWLRAKVMLAIVVARPEGASHFCDIKSLAGLYMLEKKNAEGVLGHLADFLRECQCHAQHLQNIGAASLPDELAFALRLLGPASALQQTQQIRRALLHTACQTTADKVARLTGEQQPGPVCTAMADFLCRWLRAVHGFTVDEHVTDETEVRELARADGYEQNALNLCHQLLKISATDPTAQAVKRCILEFQPIQPNDEGTAEQDEFRVVQACLKQLTPLIDLLQRRPLGYAAWCQLLIKHHPEFGELEKEMLTAQHTGRGKKGSLNRFLTELGELITSADFEPALSRQLTTILEQATRLLNQ